MHKKPTRSYYSRRLLHIPNYETVDLAIDMVDLAIDMIDVAVMTKNRPEKCNQKLNEQKRVGQYVIFTANKTKTGVKTSRI